MSWQIPTLIEQDIKNGKAQYRTFQTGSGGQSILPVPSNSYVVIFGYDFSPSGFGIRASSSDLDILTNLLSPYGTQQISFYTGTDFYPFIHHVDVDINFIFDPLTAAVFYQGNVMPEIIARQLYITSTNDVTITHGLINDTPVASSNAIPITNRTPQGLTYGGAALATATQTDLGSAVTPLQFMQPSPKDYQDFAFGLLPANADNQAFATPDAARGLIPADLYTANNFPDESNRAINKYFLCLHYALYTETVPEYRG
jgi:hypothetical protein